MKKHLVTYGDTNYKDIKESFLKSAVTAGFFDEIHSFSELDLDAGFYKKIYEPVKSCRGGGYWIWKPYFVKKILNNLETNDILIYCDAGCTINKNGKNRFNQYIDMVLAAESGTVDFALNWREYQFTKAEVFSYFQSASEIMNSAQLVGGILILRKCPHTIKLVDLWLETAVNHPFLFTDEQKSSQYEGFIDHRHDQSIFSVIRKTYGANIIPNETSFRDFEKKGQPFPFWATQFKPS